MGRNNPGYSDNEALIENAIVFVHYILHLACVVDLLCSDDHACKARLHWNLYVAEIGSKLGPKKSNFSGWC